MVIVKLYGGLGNQMFQYAAGRRLAHHLRVKLKLDVSYFATYKLRSFELDVFALKAQFATQAEIDWLKHGKASRWRKFGLYLKGGRCEPVYIKEKHFHLNPEIMTLHDNTYLDGYWQCEKYFEDVKDLIRGDFTIRMPPSRPALQLAERICSVNSVSLHVRRGDYVSNPVTNQYHGSLGIEYYNRCMDYIRERILEPHFFAFSDDPAWVIEQFKSDPALTVVDVNDVAHAYEDLRLMSLCKHHIIANSTFSWWGAWLNPNPGKIVLAPKKWFNDPGLDSSDVIPETWIRL